MGNASFSENSNGIAANLETLGEAWKFENLLKRQRGGAGLRVPLDRFRDGFA